MRWVTRRRPKIDRLASPWLIRRFVDPQAQFLFVPVSEIRQAAIRTGAIPFDLPDGRPEVELVHPPLLSRAGWMLSGWVSRQCERRELSDLSAHLQRDLGLIGDQAERENPLPWWRPNTWPGRMPASRR